MEWLIQLISIDVIVMLIPIVIIFVVLCIAVVKSNNKHKAQIDKIKYGYRFDDKSS